jgi:hypothetical protein
LPASSRLQSGESLFFSPLLILGFSFGDFESECLTEMIEHLDDALIPLIGVELSMCHMNSDLRRRERSGRERERGLPAV